MHENLLWREWVGLHELYKTGKTVRKIDRNPYVKHLIKRGFLDKSRTKITTQQGFKTKYERELLERYGNYKAFLDANNLANPNSRYTEDDIQSMMLIKENCQQILEAKDTRRGISSKFFEKSDSKHLEKHPGLEKAVLRLLGIEFFPEQDPKNKQYLCVVMCQHPQAIILCENIAFLKMPWRAKEKNIELWFAGGSNLSMLADVPIARLNNPIYYSCDWDYHGLRIYERVRKYIPTIKLLYPSATNQTKSVDTENHASKWRAELPLSGLDPAFYSYEAVQLISKLVKDDEWIEEESNNFAEMIQLNQVTSLD